MAKTKENAGSKAAAKAKRASAKAKKTKAAKDAAAIKAVRDAEAQREVDETSAAEEQTTPPAQETVEDQAPEVDEPAPKKKRTQGRQKGYNTPKAEIERQEQIKEAMEYRLIGYTYRQIAEQMNVATSTAYKWVAEGLAEITQETAEELRRVMFEQCQQIGAFNHAGRMTIPSDTTPSCTSPHKAISSLRATATIMVLREPLTLAVRSSNHLTSGLSF